MLARLMHLPKFNFERIFRQSDIALRSREKKSTNLNIIFYKEVQLQKRYIPCVEI